MLTVSNLECSLGSHRFSWSFALQASQWLAVVGESGVGKSTLLNALLGFQSVDAGELSWLQRSLLNLPVPERPFGVLFQKDNVFEHLSVYKNLSLGLSPNRSLNERERQAVEAAAERFQLSGVLNQKAQSLSGGQQQRVALARVFLQNKPILLLDEPFSSLDPGLRRDGIQWVQDMKETQGSTIIMVTHHLNEIEDYTDSIFEGVSSNQWTQYPPSTEHR